jgi:RNA polymerase sigma-70 factor, ECF subfamily
MLAGVTQEDAVMTTPVTARLTATNAFAAQTEEALTAQAKDGSTLAFGELVERYERRVFRLARNITRNHEDAEDVVQNAFVQAFKNLSRFRGDSRFYTWLVRITVNEAIMKMRRRRFNEVSIDNALEADDDVVPWQLEDWGPNPEQRYSQEELQKILTETIGELDPGYRTVFQLRDVEELSTKETAQLLDLSLTAVKTRVRRARKQLRDSLDKHFRSGDRKESSQEMTGSSRHVDC